MAEKDEKEVKDAGLSPKYLKGLKFRGSEMKETKEDGRKKKSYIPFERNLTLADVLSWKDNGDSVTIVTADGQKYNVSKKSGE